MPGLHWKVVQNLCIFVISTIMYTVLCLSVYLSVCQQILEGYILFLAPIYDRGMISWCWFLLSKSTYSTIFVLLVCQLCNMKFCSLKIYSSLFCKKYVICVGDVQTCPNYCITSTSIYKSKKIEIFLSLIEFFC